MHEYLPYLAAISVALAGTLAGAGLLLRLVVVPSLWKLPDDALANYVRDLMNFGNTFVAAVSALGGLAALGYSALALLAFTWTPCLPPCPWTPCLPPCPWYIHGLLALVAAASAFGSGALNSALGRGVRALCREWEAGKAVDLVALRKRYASLAVGILGGGGLALVLLLTVAFLPL